MHLPVRTHAFLKSIKYDSHNSNRTTEANGACGLRRLSGGKPKPWEEGLRDYSRRLIISRAKKARCKGSAEIISVTLGRIQLEFYWWRTHLAGITQEGTQLSPSVEADKA
ncbi:hypothetical protein MATL_G00223210 [Megalops atlanticus]|uniref:Uncharacterized protein n=1 Tax=Megalops atlanticus TaxID=7932 RepID=A0A9D3T324_MEGAT|nr:hypothetical protein MATL_G00223210 [Megalops atlanticus]